MMNSILTSLMNLFTRESPDDLMDESEEQLATAAREASEIDDQLKLVEREIENCERKEDDIRKEGECLLMSTHDEGNDNIDDKVRAMVQKELRKLSSGLSKKREALELRVIKLQIKRAAVLGEQRKAEHLLSICGRTAEPEITIREDKSDTDSESTENSDANPLVMN
eukprot:TRINITY_DN33528_c0_g1_i1.p1 TRINITY_DN33528_c0_g1~~TRINITY_DN33528_c0_g1_i1.p1  ORF type:complete len:180 (+),score=47.19 TRINITY_DN33528_c0_g1_i1:42-542(+)